MLPSTEDLPPFRHQDPLVLHLARKAAKGMLAESEVGLGPIMPRREEIEEEAEV